MTKLSNPCGFRRDVAPIGAPIFEATKGFQQSRRSFLTRSARNAVGALTALDFLGYFLSYGAPVQAATEARRVDDKIREADDPRYLIYWFLEGGWESYDMFSPVVTANNVLTRLDNISKERYRVLKWGQPGYEIKQQGNIRYGYLADGGKDLFKDMAVLSSMETGSFHSGDRLHAHMGSYDLQLTSEREDDERSVMQAFCEVYGKPYILPNVSWHYWLSDGELNEVQYTGRRGYYTALGPPQAHTIYGGTPSAVRDLLSRIQASAGDPVNARIEQFLGDVHANIRSDSALDVVKSYDSARDIYSRMVAGGKNLDPAQISRMFTDGALRDRFQVTPQDELISYNSINGNKARSKFSPKANVQAMMTYEMLRDGLGCGFWIESREIRGYDAHRERGKLWGDAPKFNPIGQTDQTNDMNADLWKPLGALTDSLKNTQYKQTGTSLWDRTTIVLTSEFGRTIHGDVDAIAKMSIPDAEKKKMIDGQDISQHWPVTSAAFLGGTVKGDSQYGTIGENTLHAVPLMPNGSLDPAFDPVTGDQKPGTNKDPKSSIPDHGDVYATALYLSGIDPQVAVATRAGR